ASESSAFEPLSVLANNKADLIALNASKAVVSLARIASFKASVILAFKLISNEFFSVQRYLKAYLIKKKFYKYFSLFLSLIKIKTFLQVFIFPIKSIHLGLQRSIEIEMMTTKRFEKAVTKLYKAFH